jgi:type VI protein secretion system component VasF
MHIETWLRAYTTPKTRVISPRLRTQMTSSQAQREHPLTTHAHPNARNRCQKGGHRAMRVVFLIVVALLVLTLGGLEVIASRRLPVADPLPNAAVSTSWHWR